MSDVGKFNASSQFEDRQGAFDRIRGQLTEDERSGEVPAASSSDNSPSTAIDPAGAVVPTPIVSYDEPTRSFIVPLADPFTIDGCRLNSVRLVPPTFADVEAVTGGDITELEMHARMAGVPIAALRAMRWKDFEAVIAAARRLAPDMKAA